MIVTQGQKIYQQEVTSLSIIFDWTSGEDGYVASVQQTCQQAGNHR
jgi:hypothetical protein